MENLRNYLIQRDKSRTDVGFIQYLDSFIRDIQYNVNINIMILDLYANLTSYLSQQAQNDKPLGA
jgi:hypothetical protein